MAGKLSARDHQIAALLASGLTYRECGERLKLSDRTIRRAMERTELRAEVDAIRGRAVEAGLGKLCEGFTGAVTELERLVREARAADAVKLGAVRLAIEAVLKVRENVTLSREVAELRAILDEPTGGSSPPEEDRGKPSGSSGSGSELGSTPGEPGGDTDAVGNQPGPLASSAAEGSVDAGFTFGDAAGWKV